MRRTTLLAAAVGLAMASAGLGWWVGSRAQTVEQAVASARPPAPAALTEPVEHRELVATVAFRGAVAPAVELRTPLVAPEGSLPVVTGRPVADGAEVPAGAAAVEVAGRPVLVLPGAVAAYRDLAEGDVGPDVLQLEEALAALGLRPGRVDGAFDGATAASVGALWRRAGYDPAAAERTDPVTGAVVRSVRVPRAELLFAPVAPVVVRGVEPGADGTGGPVLVLTGTDLVVHGSAVASVAEHLAAGTPVDIASDRTGQVTPGAVEAVGAPTPDTGDHPVSVRPAAPLAETSIGEQVRLVVELGRTDGPQLVVPLAAVASRADGHQEVVVVDGEDRRRVPVRVVLEADGYAAVVPVDGSLEPGDEVLVGG